MSDVIVQNSKNQNCLICKRPLTKILTDQIAHNECVREFVNGNSFQEGPITLPRKFGTDFENNGTKHKHFFIHCPKCNERITAYAINITSEVQLSFDCRCDGEKTVFHLEFDLRYKLHKEIDTSALDQAIEQLRGQLS
jgi:hypothetical protein